MSESRPPASPVSRQARGARVILAAQMVRLVFRIASGAVLARLLSPGAYGLHGMAALIYSLLYMLRDFGVFPAMQQPGFTPQRFNALCRVAFLGGLALAGVCLALGPAAAWFFAEPRLPAVLAAMALAFVFGGTSVPALALLYREERVQAAVAAETGATVAAGLVAIAAAAAGAGVWALVLMSVLNELFAAVGAWPQCPRRPGLDTSGTPWRKLLGFGFHLTGHGVSSYLARTVDQVVVGRSAGTLELGLYGRGVQATTLPVQLALAPFSGWAVATLTRQRAQPESFVALYRRLLNGLQYFSLPPATVCLVAPGFAVHLLFGEQWLAATEVVRWLGFALLVQPWLSTQSWLLQAAGRARRLMVVSTLGLATITVACVAVRQHGIAAVAAAAAAGTILHAAIAILCCTGLTPVRARDGFEPARTPLVLHAGLAGVLAVLPVALPGMSWWLPLPVIAAYYAAAWLVAPAVRRDLRGHFLMHA